jgi:CHAT domain-containing protein
MLREFLDLLGFIKPPKNRKINRIFKYKKPPNKNLFVFLLLTSFLFFQGLTWQLRANSLPVVPQTSAKVIIAQSTTAPDALVQEAKKLYQQEQFSEALARLQQAEGAFAAKRDVLKQAMTLDLQGQVYLALGQPEVAAERFSGAATTYDRKGDKTGALKSRINQAQALRKGGFYRRALETLKQLNANLTDQTDPQLKAIALRSLGITQRLIGDLDDAKKSIEESLKIAESLPSPAREENSSSASLVLGNIAKDRGQTAQDRGNNSEAQTYFQEAIAHYQKAAETATTPTARIEAQLNQLSVVGESGQAFTDAERELLRQVRETLDKLPLSRTAVHARINWARMVMELKDEDKVNPQDIAQQLAIALEQARKLKDQRSESYALGQLGVLRQQLGQLEQAQENTKQALAIAQSIGAGDIAYRWQWQLGQILRQEGKTEGAIASYEAAVNNLQDLRSDLVTVNPDAQFSFRESVEPVYREFAGLLLQSENPEDLKKARTAIESLQQAELVNFFRENCLTSKPVKIDDIDQKAAVIYPIVLADRLEVVLSLPGDQVKRHTIPKARTEVNDIFTRLRQVVAPSVVNPNRATPTENESNRATPTENEPNPATLTEDDPSRARIKIRRLVDDPETRKQYLKLAQEVYDWLIRPFEEDVKASQVETLVFVLDGPLLNMPMAVLHDGEKFLVEKYAIALTPGLQLLDSKPLPRGQLTALKAGLTQERELKIGSSGQLLRFSQLPNVDRELKQIQSQVSGELILNEQFTTTAIQKAIGSVPFPVVHLATHGQFSSNAEETFILTWDDRLNINQLNQLLRGREEGGRKAIELLVLSACQTATGDERAALGLAGVAVRAGARSTLATLWVVDDEGTADLMIRFYEELKDTKVSKAEALRRAQLWLMKQDTRYESPYYWAPFVLVGNWL